MMKPFCSVRWGYLLLVLLLAGCAAQKHSTEIVIVSTNDIHGAIDRMPALATLVQRTRAANEHVLLIDAGDKWTGNPYVDLNHDKGRPVVALLDSLGCDLSTVGNHGFDHGVPLLAERIAQAHAPTVLANIRPASDSSSFPSLPPYLFKTVGGLRLGFLGLLETANDGRPAGRAANYRDVACADPLITASKYVGLKDSCDLLIGLTHLGFDLDSALAVQMPQLGLILGGHSHTVLPEGRNVNGVLITQTGKSLQYAGITRLAFHKHRLVGIQNHLVRLDTVPSDPRVAAWVEQYKQAPELLRQVGEAEAPMEKVALMNLLTDAIIDRTKTDFAFYNWNGMRIDSHPAGAFIVADVFAMEPFGSELYQLQMKLADLRELIMTKFNHDKKEGHTVDIYPAGGTYTIQTDSTGDACGVLFYDRAGNPLTDEAQLFEVALPDYLHGNYHFAQRGQGRPLGLAVTDLLMDYLSAHRPAPVDPTPRVAIRPRAE